MSTLKGSKLTDGRCTVIDFDFIAPNGGTVANYLEPHNLAVRAVAAAGTPVQDFIDGGLNGQFNCAHDNTNENQIIGLDSADQLVIDPTKAPVMEVRIGKDATFSADQRLVFGMASAYNAAQDSVASHVWFRIEGASDVLLIEGDDGTTDTDDQSTGITMSNDTFYTCCIDMTDLSAVKFTVDGVDAGTVDVSALTAAKKLQPYIQLEKDGGTETDSITIDYIKIVQDRA